MEEEDSAKKLFKLSRSIDEWWEDTRKFVNKIKAKQEPRYVFNTWRDSTDGKTWKQKQYQKQDYKCLICDEHLDVENCHIDHIKPLGQYPTEALNLDNLQLVHPKCNLGKGGKS